MLVSAQGVWKGLAFILGWLACLVAVLAIVLALTGGHPSAPKSAPSTAVLAAKLLIGVSLVFYGDTGADRRRPLARPHLRPRIWRPGWIAARSGGRPDWPCCCSPGAWWRRGRRRWWKRTCPTPRPGWLCSLSACSPPRAFWPPRCMWCSHLRRRGPPAETAIVDGGSRVAGDRGRVPVAGFLAHGEEHLPAHRSGDRRHARCRGVASRGLGDGFLPRPTHARPTSDRPWRRVGRCGRSPRR
ncbi:GAP family protein [Streptomyces sp. NPDC001982]|uniref:GAP family protein n=1 Tax=Streptomyces sp. NPDC001982 TaxID=3154405 RepID=UPI003324B39B